MQEVNGVDDWQSSKSSMVQRSAHLFNNELLSDVRFIVGEGDTAKRIPAHKLLLSMGSCVFNAMFNGPLASDGDEIEICDVEPSAFHTLLKFLYADIVEISDVNYAISTLYAAKKYLVPSLQVQCVQFLERNLVSKNAILLLNQARLHDELDLEKKCWAMIDSSPEQILTSKYFTDLDLDTLCLILSRDSLGIREADLFEAVLKWSIAECKRQELPISGDNQRSVLGRAFNLIRFSQMTASEFSYHVTRSQLLTKDEIILIFQSLTEGIQNDTFPHKPRGIQNDTSPHKPRNSKIESTPPPRLQSAETSGFTFSICREDENPHTWLFK